MQFKLVKNRFTVIEPYVKGKNVLDIGCVDARPGGEKKYKSTGLHLFLKDKASKLLGVDIDEAGVGQMKRDGFDVVQANAEDMDLDEQFDCIVAGEIIEHLSNPGLFLANVQRHLAKNGVFILTTANAFGIVSFFRILRKNEVKVHAEHTCWYDPKTITELLSRYSFEIKEISFSNKSKWYLKKNLYKLKYQLPRFICSIRPYFSGSIIVIASLKQSS